MSSELDNIDRALRDVCGEVLRRCMADPEVEAALDIPLEALLADCEIHATLSLDDTAKRTVTMLRAASDCVVANRLETARSMITNAAKLLEVI